MFTTFIIFLIVIIFFCIINMSGIPMFLTFSGDRTQPGQTQPGQTQPGQTQPGQERNLYRTQPRQDVTWTGPNLDRHNLDRDITQTGAQPGQDTTQTGHSQDRDKTRTRTDSVFNPDTKNIIFEYITMVPFHSLYSDLGSAERLGCFLPLMSIFCLVGICKNSSGTEITKLDLSAA